MAFSKGSSQCLGMQLAWAELYMALVAVFVRFRREMEIVDTVRQRDVDVSRDIFVSAADERSKGILVMVG